MKFRYTSVLSFILILLACSASSSNVEIKSYMCPFDKRGNSNCAKIERIEVRVSNTSGSVFVESEKTIMPMVKEWFNVYRKERPRLTIDVVDMKGRYLFEKIKSENSISVNIAAFNFDDHMAITVVAIAEEYYQILSKPCESKSKECIKDTLENYLTKTLSGIE